MFDYKDTVDGLIQKEIEEGRLAGASLLVRCRDREVYFNAYGQADMEKKKPMRRDTIIRLFSMTKPITAAAVMILAQRGELDLKDPVSKYLPYFAGQTVWTPQERVLPVNRENTITDLLNMTSGIPYPDLSHVPGRRMDTVFKELWERRKRGERVDTQEYLRRIAQIPLCFQPGERWMYGLSADVLGGVVEAVSGMTYGAFLKRELFEPLEMPDTGFFVPEEKRERFAQIYQWEEEGKRLVPYEDSHLGEYYGEDTSFESGGAGLVSTIDDYSHFTEMMLHKGEYNGKRILGRKTVEFMTSDRLTREQKSGLNWDSTAGYGYGCLMRILIDQGEAGTIAPLGEYGWDGWTGNYVTMDPEDDMTLIFFMQRCGSGCTPLVRKLRMATFGALEELMGKED